MIYQRLSIALEHGGLPAEGRILVLRPTLECDLAAVPKDRALLVQGFRPDHDMLSSQGFTVAPDLTDDSAFAAAVIFVPRARKEAMGLIALAAARVAPGGAIWVDGQKTDGVEAVLRDLKARVCLSDAFSKSHGKCTMFIAPGPTVLSDWLAKPTSPALGFTAHPGCFSADAVDAGSALLAEHIPTDIKGRVADLGAGWGWLSAEVLRRAPKISEIHVIEAEHAALTSARDNIRDPRAQFHWADATTITGLPRIETVVMNPPFHRGRAGDPGLGVAFIRKAAQILPPNGTLWMVANRHLPYEPALRTVFGDVAEIAGTSAFKIFRAARPVRAIPGTSPDRPQSPGRRGG